MEQMGAGAFKMPVQPQDNVDEKQKLENKTDKIKVIGARKDANFEGSTIIKTEDAEGRITEYAIRKKENGELEGNEIRYQSDGSTGPVYQLHESDFDKLKQQGVLDSYEGALAAEGSKKINDAKNAIWRIYKEGDKVNPSWGKMPEDSLMNPAKEALENLSPADQEKVATDFFNDTIGKNISNNKDAYSVYGVFKNTPFGQKFKQLEDKRLKEAEFTSGFTL